MIMIVIMMIPREIIAIRMMVVLISRLMKINKTNSIINKAIAKKRGRFPIEKRSVSKNCENPLYKYSIGLIKKPEKSMRCNLKFASYPFRI